MSAIESFLNMGGYAAFVWPAYAVAAVALGGLIAASIRELRARERETRLLEAERPRARRRGVGTGEPADEA